MSVVEWITALGWITEWGWIKFGGWIRVGDEWVRSVHEIRLDVGSSLELDVRVDSEIGVLD